MLNNKLKEPIFKDKVQRIIADWAELILFSNKLRFSYQAIYKKKKERMKCLVSKETLIGGKMK